MNWTVKRLKEELQRFDDDAIIVLSEDEEGNGFGPLYSVEEMDYDPNSREVHYRELTEGMIEQGYTEEDIRTGGRLAVVFWP